MIRDATEFDAFPFDGKDGAPGPDRKDGRDGDWESMIWAQAEAKLANFMTANGLATGHGENFDALLRELEWQIKELRARTV